MIRVLTNLNSFVDKNILINIENNSRKLNQYLFPTKRKQHLRYSTAIHRNHNNIVVKRDKSLFKSQLFLSKSYATFDSNDKMPPIVGSNYNQYLDQLINENRVIIFSKSWCPFCSKVKTLFDELKVDKVVIELDQIQDGNELHEVLKAKLNKTSVPQVFINGQHIGGCDDTFKAKDEGSLANLLKGHEYDYDLIVVGGGSGGLAASKEAVKYGKKVAVLDFVVPTPIGTTWGLGGTCVNVGCIPKKLMHTSALLGQALKDAIHYGWELSDAIPHNWVTMKDEIQKYVKSINFGYRVQLRESKVDYINAYGSFVDKNKIKVTDKKGNEKFLTSQTFIIATGERPRYPSEVIGAKEYSITSDDMFSLPYNPGKTLVIGASYVALECAGFLRGFGLDVTVMVRSILLRGFDQEMAEKAGDYMKEEGIRFLRPCIPSKIEQIESGQPGRLRVTARMTDSGEEVVEECNTVLFAIGRDPCTDNIGLENTGVIREKSGKIKVINEQTNIPNIYAIGDILHGKLELTPVAIEAGVLLARRLYGKSDVQCDYINVPTTVFTPLEYGACGYSEEAAIAEFGEDNLEIYISNFVPLEWQVPHRPVNACFAKLICLKTENERLLGFHYLGPNAGEVTQLVGLPLKMKATKADIDALIGIHPTCAEVFTTMVVTKRSGLSADAKGC